MADGTRRARATLATVLLLAFAVTGCGEAPSDGHVIDEPVTVAEIEGSDLPQLTLTSGAVQRLDVTTAAVEQAGDALVVPSGAVVVDPDGSLWVYTSPEPDTYVRTPVEVDHEADGLAYLTDGPSVGTQVVALGAAELYGAEHGIGH